MRVQYIFSSKRTGKFRKSPSINNHSVAFPKLVREVIRTSDIILEVLDARFIDKTRNKDMERVVLENNKKIIYVINKVDLIDINELKSNYDLSTLRPYVFVSCKSKIGKDRLRDIIKMEVRKLKLKDKKARVGIIGYPNTGKSTLINVLVGRRGTSTSPEAGFTKVMQKIRLNKDIFILDTPGVFLENEDPEINSKDLKKHAQIGIKQYDKVKSPDLIVLTLMRQNPGTFEKFYGIDANGDCEILLEELGRRKKLLKKREEIDIERTASMVLKDWQENKIK